MRVKTNGQATKQRPVAKTSLTAICANCKHVVNFRNVGYTSRPVKGLEGVECVGIRCPKCDHWYPSYYTNPELNNLAKNATSRKDKRVYNHKYRKFQQWVKRKLKNGVRGQPYQS